MNTLKSVGAAADMWAGPEALGGWQASVGNAAQLCACIVVMMTACVIANCREAARGFSQVAAGTLAAREMPGL